MPAVIGAEHTEDEAQAASDVSLEHHTSSALSVLHYDSKDDFELYLESANRSSSWRNTKVLALLMTSLIVIAMFGWWRYQAVKEETRQAAIKQTAKVATKVETNVVTKAPIDPQLFAPKLDKRYEQLKTP